MRDDGTIDFARAMLAGRPVEITNAARRKDPTRTGRLRREFEGEFLRRWGVIKSAIEREVHRKNGFGIKTQARYGFGSNPTRVAAFRSWFGDQVNKQLFDGRLSESRDEALDHFWGRPLAAQAYRRGMIDASGQIKRAGGRVSESYIEDALARSSHGNAIRSVYERGFDDLVGITEKVSDQIAKVLGEGLAVGKHPFQLARDMIDRVEKIGEYRSRLIARTEVLRAYNEAELNVYEDAGLEGVTLVVEWITAGDERVCQLCKDAAQREWTVATARGALPLHPNCRCAWAPKVVEGKEITL